MRPASMNIRELLQKHPDGLTAPELAKMLKKRPSLIRTSLHTMPDVYIDRWVPSVSKWTAIWCRHTPPPNAPMPEGSVCTARTRC